MTNKYETAFGVFESKSKHGVREGDGTRIFTLRFNENEMKPIVMKLVRDGFLASEVFDRKPVEVGYGKSLGVDVVRQKPADPVHDKPKVVVTKADPIPNYQADPMIVQTAEKLASKYVDGVDSEFMEKMVAFADKNKLSDEQAAAITSLVVAKVGVANPVEEEVINTDDF